MKLSKTMFLKTTALSVLLAIAACNPASENKSKTRDGNCTQNFIDSYNSVVTQLRDYNLHYQSSAYNESEKISKLQTVNSTCKSFYSNHGGVNCKAMVNYTAKTIGGQDFKKECDIATSMLNKGRTLDQDKTPEKPASNGSSLKPEQIKFVVLDPLSMRDVPNSAAKDRDPKVIIKGHVKTSSNAGNDIGAGKVYCLLNSESRTSWLNQNTTGRILKTTDIKETNNGLVKVIIFKLDDDTLSMVCAKTKSSEFLVSELKEALDGILDVQVSP